MSLKLKSEIFKIFDVSEIKVEGKLAFERSDETIIPRNEDEAFIREFIAERDFGAIGSNKICQWPNLRDWKSIAWAVSDMQHFMWVRTEYLEGKATLPPVMEPDPERDQVTETESYFTGNPLTRLATETSYKYESGKQNVAWKFPDAYLGEHLSMSGVKRIDDFIAIYNDFSKMNGVWATPEYSCLMSVRGKQEFDDIKDDDDYKQSVQSITVTASYDGKAIITDGDIGPESNIIGEYTDANGNERSMQFSPSLIWYETLGHKTIKDGKEKVDEYGNEKQKYKTVSVKRKRTVDVNLGSNANYSGDKTWKMVSAAAEVRIEVTYTDFENDKSETLRKQLVVKSKIQERWQIINEETRAIIKEMVPKTRIGGVMTGLRVTLGSIGWMIDVDWNTRIEADNGQDEG